ncbi:MAG: sulfatase-like hydrolase/transferase [Mariniblastus sp.]
MLKQISSIVLVLLTGLASSNVACSDERQPNIILVMADDVSWEAFGSYGGEDYKTPNLDQLASQGIRFSHCYSTPICTTSRVKIMTGKYNFRNYTHFGYLNPTEKTFGNLLQAAGYKTAIAGKWQLNGLYNSLPGHLDASRPIASGFDEYMLWQLTTQKGGKNSKGGERFWSPPIEHNGKFLTKEMNHGKYGPDLFCDFICDFMERNQSKPFFVYYPMVLVHDPFVPTPDTLGDQPLATANKAPKDKAKRKENFVAMVNYMDKIVGRIVDKVDEIGQSENTIILFTADNGTNTQISSRWNGQEIKGGKGGMKDNGTHVPLIAYWKGHTPSGLVSNDLIDFTDFYATFAQTAGVKLGQNDPRDGTSFLPQLMGKPGTPRDWVFCHYEPYWNKISGQFVRNQDFKLYRSGDFFQVPTDLSEANNLKGTTDKEIQKIMAQLSGVMAQSPPAPQGVKADKNTKERPVYPNWKMKN